jgi:hypothetical protein
MSPLFENKKIILGNSAQKNNSSFDTILGWMFIFLSLTMFFGENLLIILFLPLGIFILAYEPIAKAAKKSAEANFEITYDLICSEAIKLSKKKDLSSTEVDKYVNKLVTKSFDYEEVLDVIGFVEDTLNHKSNLKKKVKYVVPDTKVTLKAGEILYFRTHTIWAQGSPDNNVVKDIGYFYLSNKRFIFIGEYNSHSITLSRIVNFEIGNNYALICKTAGKNEIFEINKLESLSYLKFLYEKLT